MDRRQELDTSQPQIVLLLPHAKIQPAGFHTTYANKNEQFRTKTHACNVRQIFTLHMVWMHHRVHIWKNILICLTRQASVAPHLIPLLFVFLWQDLGADCEDRSSKLSPCSDNNDLLLSTSCQSELHLHIGINQSEDKLLSLSPAQCNTKEASRQSQKYGSQQRTSMPGDPASLWTAASWLSTMAQTQEVTMGEEVWYLNTLQRVISKFCEHFSACRSDMDVVICLTK